MTELTLHVPDELPALGIVGLGDSQVLARPHHLAEQSERPLRPTLLEPLEGSLGAGGETLRVGGEGGEAPVAARPVQPQRSAPVADLLERRHELVEVGRAP